MIIYLYILPFSTWQNFCLHFVPYKHVKREWNRVNRFKYSFLIISLLFIHSGSKLAMICNRALLYCEELLSSHWSDFLFWWYEILCFLNLTLSNLPGFSQNFNLHYLNILPSNSKSSAVKKDLTSKDSKLFISIRWAKWFRVVTSI